MQEYPIHLGGRKDKQDLVVPRGFEGVIDLILTGLQVLMSFW